MTSPYQPPQTPSPPALITILDLTRLVLPDVCVVCGSRADETVQYTQDRAPIPLPGIAIVRTAQVSAPYCAEHAARFRHRFNRLRTTQGIAYAITLIGGLLWVPPFNRILDLPMPARIAAGILALAAFTYLIASIFVIKPILYDVYFIQSGQRLRIKAGLPFLASLIATNAGNVDSVI